MKTKICFLLLLFTTATLFSEGYLCDGTWHKLWDGLFQPEINWTLPQKDYSWGSGKYKMGYFEIDTQSNLFYHYDAYQGFSISEIETIDQETERGIISQIVEYRGADVVWEESVILHFLSDDIVYIFNEKTLNDVHEIPEDASKWKYIRISGPARIPVKNAVLNDTRVRCRTEPNLNCETWGYLNAGDKVVIKDISDAPFEIDSESWYWYKVESDTLPDGWVYGKYLDIEE